MANKTLRTWDELNDIKIYCETLERPLTIYEYWELLQMSDIILYANNNVTVDGQEYYLTVTFDNVTFEDLTKIIQDDIEIYKENCIELDACIFAFEYLTKTKYPMTLPEFMEQCYVGNNQFGDLINENHNLTLGDIYIFNV